MNPADYQTYRGLPLLAGVCSLEEAMRPGLSVEECVRRLKRYHYAFKRLHQIFTARITAEPIYELKMAFSLHAYLCAEHVADLRKRVSEMREPPLGLEAVPDPNLEIFFDEILAAPTTEELLLGVYGKAVPALQMALQRHLSDTNLLVDHPSVRLCRYAMRELYEVAEYGAQSIACLVDQAAQEKATEWLQLLDDCLAAAGALDGVDTIEERVVVRRYSATPYVYDGVPRRDERFPDPYNMGVNAEAFIYDEQYPPKPKILMLFYKRLREIDVPEMMASIITETPGKPWGYYLDMTRQLWDEARHAMMGEVGFVSLGIDWRKVMINYTWSLGLNTQLEPWERHAVLYYIERGLMPNSGKRFEWEVALASQNPLSALFQDYDWADEVLHSNIGRDWYVPEFKSTQEALRYGDECWSKVLSDWTAWREQGLTQHRNWWPEVYTQACEQWGVEPDPKVLAYNESYENKRADLKSVSG
ncbi:MAG: hypothetical protein JO316_15170 [Abitibacteriaceae bacterium]|nr:hypothetical protein [Abditibacteriaceae bacterium]MBV9866693.1 hypothetical protein [Abditibacteriaceae bacterium]